MSLLGFAFIALRPIETQKLKVEISNFNQKPTTYIYISVFNENDFLEKSIQTKKVSANGNEVFVEFDLPPGEYAVSTYHDTNDNGELDRYFIGKPKEPYGFSNNVRPFGPPSFDKCMIEIGESARTIAIELID